ncbi:hypothetical protein [Gordonibacter urolithinfaciens]|uniref:hypothetical protein n=1 Tax=Gordonibacter urolithinfaciens TaxID=1335613 RepID=UPI003A8EAC7F
MRNASEKPSSTTEAMRHGMSAESVTSESAEATVASTPAAPSSSVDGAVLLRFRKKRPTPTSAPKDKASVRYSVNWRSRKKEKDGLLVAPINMGENSTR